MHNIFKDAQGKTVIAQIPNLPLIVWFVGFIVTKIQIHPQVTQLADALSFGALFTWAWMEIFSGVNVFRRMLGAVVLAFVLWGKVFA